MLKTILITNYKNETLELDIFNPKKSGFNIRQIDGLGPVRANIITSKIVTKDGDIFNSSRADKRNIVFTLGFDMVEKNENLNSIESIRHMSYRYFPLKSEVKIKIKTDKRELFTYGYVETNEPDIFSNDETCRISVICPDSYFTSEKERDIELTNLRNVFKFPFEVLERDLDDIDILKNDTDDTIQMITEDSNDENDYLHNGNVSYNYIIYDNLYLDFLKYKYNTLENFTYEELFNFK